MNYETASLVLFFLLLAGWIIKLTLAKFLKVTEIETTHYDEDKDAVFKVLCAFRSIEDEIKTENPTVRFPGIETGWIAEKAGFTKGKTIGALSELEKEGKVHSIWNFSGDTRWYSGRSKL